MENNENDKAFDLEILKQRLENHREYISRQWQYYAAFILLNGLLINGVRDLSKTDTLTVRALGIAFVMTSAVFFHLISWTKMRIHRNASRINELAKENIIEVPKARESITLWLLVSIVAFTLCWLIWLFSIDLTVSLVSCLLFIVIAGNSLLSTRTWDKGEMKNQVMSEEKGNDENLRLAYSEAHNNRRHYSNLRFAVFSVFFAVLGGVVSVAFGIVEIKSPTSPDIVYWARIAGLLFTFIFFMFEILGELNLRHFGRVARELEDLLGYRQLKNKNFPYIPRAFYFTCGMYVLLLLFWIFSIYRRA